MNKIFPDKLKPGDEVRIVASARSIFFLNKEIKNIANQWFADLGLKLTFGRHVNEIDEFNSSSIKSRVEDLHEAFSDKMEWWWLIFKSR